MKVNGLNLYYKVKGKGKPIIFLHSALNDSSEFDELAKHFANYRVYQIDLREHGKSKSCLPYRLNLQSKPHRASVSLAARDISMFMDKLGLESAVLLCSSFGCHVGLTVAMRSTKVVGLALINYRPLTFLEKVARVLIRPLKPLVLIYIEIMLKNYFPKLTQKTISKIIDYSKKYSKEELEKILDKAKINRRALSFVINAELGYREPWLKNMKKAIRVINGENGKRIKARLKKIEEKVDNFKVCHIPAAGHSVHLESPKATLFYIKEWMKEIGYD